MIPNFALSLSVDGIVLLYRVSDDWRHAGEVSLDADDFTAEVANLRATAQRLNPDNLHTKLLLPNEQIRYLTIETARTSRDDINAAIREATPMALDDMVIDFDRSGGRTFIAAVAKQTLAEAETFAIDHGFDPVSFAAVADDLTFSSEVFFGPTTHARDTLNVGANVARDTMLPVATGAVDDPVHSAPEPISDTPSENIFRGTNDAETSANDAPQDDILPVFTSRHRDTVATAETTSAPKIADDDTRQRSETNLQSFVEKLATVEPDAPAIPSPVKAEIEDAPPAVATPKSTRPKSRVKSRLLALPDDSSGLLEKMHNEPAPRAVPTPKTQADLAFAKGLAQSSETNKPRYLGLIMTAALLAIMGLVAMWANTRLENGIVGLFNNSPDVAQEAVIDPVAQAPEPIVAAIPETPTVVAPPTPDTVVTAPQIEETPPTPIVTAVPGRVLSPADAARIYAATGVWQRAPRLPDVSEQGNLEGIHTFATLPVVQEVAALSEPDLGNSIPDLRIISPRNPAPINRPLPRDDDGFVQATASGTITTTGVPVYARAPAARPPRRPTDEPVGLDDASIPSVLEAIPAGIAEAPALPNSALPTSRAFLGTTLTKPRTLTSPSTEAPQGLAAANALITLPPPASNLDVAAVAPPEDPPVLEATSQPATDVTDTLREPATAPQTAATPTEPIIETATGVAVLLADVEPRADGFVAPETFVEVITGRPAVVPPLRPGTPEIAPEVDATEIPSTETDLPQDAEIDAASEAGIIQPDALPLENIPVEETAPDGVATTEAPVLFQDPAFAGLRPTLRPTDLAPAGLQTFEAIPSLAGARPLLRPASLVVPTPEAPEEEETTAANPADISAIMASIAAAAPPSQIINPTSQAIVASPRPDPRPQNFARVVSSAQTLATRQQSREAAASTAAAVVPTAPAATAQSAPVTGGQTAVTVATAATAQNAIRLRDMNLIGVYGKEGARRALIRLSNGRFVKVEVGSSLDGGRVTAIGDSALNFVKRGKTYALQLPAS